MTRVTLQVPMSKTLRDEAEKAALDYGFSSLQEVLRVFMKRLASKMITLSFHEEGRLSPKAEKRYMKMVQDIESGKNVYEAKDIDDLMRQLSS